MDFEMLKNITNGAVSVTKENDGFHFHRFSEGEEAFYKVYNSDFYRKTFSTSGVKLELETDELTIKVESVADHRIEETIVTVKPKLVDEDDDDYDEDEDENGEKKKKRRNKDKDEEDDSETDDNKDSNSAKDEE